MTGGQDAESVMINDSGRAIVSFAQDHEGELYIVDIESGVFRIDPPPGEDLLHAVCKPLE